MKVRKYETEWGGEKLVVEISDLANQANGSVLVRYGETAVFASATMSQIVKEGGDFFPLTVNYEEKFYAAGRILGSRFIRREGRPTDEAVLTSRLIDHTIRPLFNQRTRNEVQVVVLALSVDGKNDPDVPAILASSLALSISDIPWDGPIGPVRVGYDGRGFVINPSYEARETIPMENVFCGVKGGLVNMTEVNAKEISEDILITSFGRGLEESQKIIDFQNEIIREVGKEKLNLPVKNIPDKMYQLFHGEIGENLEKALFRGGAGKDELHGLEAHWGKISLEEFGEASRANAAQVYEDGVNEIIHKNILDAPEGEERRVDGRKVDEIRPLYAQVGILPILHGSGVFFRGGTHILSLLTLGGPKQGQLIEGMEIQTTKRFMHHYNFPPFSTGETGRMGSPGRREIGHGALAERALLPVIPPREEFPYTIRIVSEAMASNGSTSQGSICASTLALMDAGVPIKNPVAGIAIGLITDGKRYKVLTDIQGPEDHFGDMDFKCAGTRNGVTAIQMDIKARGVSINILREALERAKKARLQILDALEKVIPAPRKELSPYAPRIVKMLINVDKIREVIGPGGKVINSIIAKTGAEIDIDQDGTIFITGRNHKDTEEARKIIEEIVHEYEVGEIREGPVTRLFDFGAMVDIGGGTEGMVHISELAPKRVEKVTDILHIGDMVKVKVIAIDEKGRINLSIKQLDHGTGNEKRNHGDSK